MLNSATKKFFIKVCLALMSVFILFTSYKAYIQPKYESNRIVQQVEQRQLTEHKKTIVISEDMILGKLTSKSEIVSMEQGINKTETAIDDGLLGERHTKLTAHGKYKMGLETKDIHINYIDNDKGIVSIHMPEPKLISLELPFNKVDIEKTHGWARLSMNEQEQKNFYKSYEKQLRHEITNDHNVLDNARLHNEQVVRELVKQVRGVQSIVFD